MNDTQHYRELPGLEALGEMDAVEARAFEDATRRMDVLRDLVTWRKQCRLSQQVVAEWMDTTQSAVSELESGRIDPRLSTLQRYARALGKELHVMIGEVGTPQGAVAPGVFAEEDDKSFGLILRLSFKRSTPTEVDPRIDSSNKRDCQHPSWIQLSAACRPTSGFARSATARNDLGS